MSESAQEHTSPNPFARVASWIYAAGARLHRAWRGRTSAGRGRPACAVVSVGGLTVGGAGKTPVAARLASSLASRGYRVVLASRGYRGQARAAVTVVSDGARIHSNVEIAGDESFVLAAHAPGVPVLTGKDRRIVGHHAVSVFDAEILVLDDGFQHHRLSRDFDLVCIDAVAGFGNGHVLPAGPLRESPRALRDADALCFLLDSAESREGKSGEGSHQDDGLVGTFPAKPSARVSGDATAFIRPGTSVWKALRRPVDLVPLGGGTARPLSFLRGRQVGLIAGLARPASLRRSVEAEGAKVIRALRFRDHHAYQAEDLASVKVGGQGTAATDEAVDLWVTTEKDALKILPKWVPKASVWVLRLEVDLDDESARIDEVLAVLRASGRLT